ncbi:putative signal transducing protein [Algibacter aquimarinus]|uniref:DUF2007 domain-containing protein n=1 Tax=Algibacter aquimarinus TaxID=1136748 RepID=A0ABP9HLF8_9FLAO
MSNSNYTKIYTGDFIIVQRIVSDLEKENIIPVVKDQTESARLAGFGGGIVPGFQQIYVHDDELEKAVLIIESITSQLQN